MRTGNIVGGRYILKREIARGGMCAVFEAEHLTVGRIVAIKIPHEELAQDMVIRERLRREARALWVARHPCIVDVLDCDPAAAMPYLVMEMLPGRALDGLVAARGGLPLDEAIWVTQQLLGALTSAHARGVVHRDVKPGNILLCPSGDVKRPIVKLVDFGVAFVPPSASGVDRLRLTGINTVVGTPEYMAPEQLTGESVDARADLYGAALSLYEMLIGDVPHHGEPVQILAQITQGQRPLVSSLRPELPRALDDVLGRALASEPSHRFRDAVTFSKALAHALGQADRTITDAFASNVSHKDLPPPLPPVVVPARRKFERAAFVSPVRVVDPRGRAHDGRSEDISEGGLLMMTRHKCPVDEQMELRFPLPRSGRVASMKALVRWCRGDEGKYASGVEFTETSPEARNEIAEYVRMMNGREAKA